MKSNRRSASHLRYSLSYGDLEEIMAERSCRGSHHQLRWVQRYELVFLALPKPTQESNLQEIPKIGKIPK